MRLDKYLKVSRIIKRRSLAKDIVDQGHVKIDNKSAKASTEVKVGNVIAINEKGRTSYYKITAIYDFADEEKAKTMYERMEPSL